jgi:ribosomal protein S18 acetylase RimI-like enzyme
MAPIELQLDPVAPRAASGYTVRPLVSSDFYHLQRLEEEIWSQDGAGKLCCYYLRLCTELYSDWCFIALDGDRPVGYVLNFPKGKVNYCATLAVHPEFQKTRVNYLLIRAMVKKLLTEDMEECRFLVEPSNRDARSIHESLGARVVSEVADFYHPGDLRLWSVINKDDMERIRAKYNRLRLVS